MAVAVIVDVPGGNEQLYEQLKLFPEGKLPDMPMGKDSLEVPGHERYGFLELKRKDEKWPVGKYQVKIFITPLGQQPFHAANQVGTMRFSIVDSVPPAPSSAQK